MSNDPENDLGAIAEVLKGNEIKRYNESIKLIEAREAEFFTKAYETNLNSRELKTVQIQLEQVIAICEGEISKGFHFDLQSQLGADIDKKLKQTTEQLRKALIIVKSKLAKKPPTFFDEFIIEVQTVIVQTVEKFVIPEGYINDIPADNAPVPNNKHSYLDLRHYDQTHSDYETQLNRLKRLATTEIFSLNEAQIRQQLKYLMFIERRFSQFLDLYKKHFTLFLERKFDLVRFQLEVESLFIVPKYKDATVTVEYLQNWHDVILFKQAYLLAFISEVKQVLGVIDMPGIDEILHQSNNLAQIFDATKHGFSICIRLLEEFEVLDRNTGQCIIKQKPRKGYLVFAIIDAFKNRTERNRLLARRNFTDKEVLEAFNNYLGTSFKRLKRNSAGYNQTLREAEALIRSAQSE